MQISYFKAKHAFFRFTWDDIQDDSAFVLSRYFNGCTFEPHTITKHEYFTQRALIAELFAYQLWSADFLQQLRQQADQIARRDVTPGFIVTELIAYLNEHKIVRPGYTTLQTLISEALSAERQRLGSLLAGVLDEAAKHGLAQLLVRDDTLSELAALKQDAKDFGWRQMVRKKPLDVLALAVPGDDANDREGVAEVMQSRLESGTVRARDACLFTKPLEDELV